jgi:Domain of unknown function (DUF4032)
MNVYTKYKILYAEILKHKWIESEKINHDIGFENALLDWIKKHRKKWASEQQEIDNQHDTE